MKAMGGQLSNKFGSQRRHHAEKTVSHELQDNEQLPTISSSTGPVAKKNTPGKPTTPFADREVLTEPGINEEVELTERQKELVHSSWDLLQENISNVGVIMFTKLFETHPTVKDSFFQFEELEKEDLYLSQVLKAHSLRVMHLVGKTVTRLERPDKIRDMMTSLGRGHGPMVPKVEYVDLMGAEFLGAMEEHLSEIWNEELKEAWKALFQFMTHHMKICILEYKRESAMTSL